MKYNRREFIKTMGLISGSILLFPGCSFSSKGSYRVFTEEEGNCLIALCEQIIPGDQDPGATDTGAIFFIDRQLKTRFVNEQELFKNGIASLQSYCKEKYNRLFENLGSSVQIEIMEQMEREQLPAEHWNVSQKHFFNTLLARTMQSFYGSPRHGGNKDYASYRMLKLDYPLLIGQNRYKK